MSKFQPKQAAQHFCPTAQSREQNMLTITVETPEGVEVAKISFTATVAAAKIAATRAFADQPKDYILSVWGNDGSLKARRRVDEKRWCIHLMATRMELAVN